MIYIKIQAYITIKYEKGNLRKKIINFYLNIMRRQITTYEKNFVKSSGNIEFFEKK